MPIHPHDERTYQIIGAAMEVHRILHRGLKEELYCDALEVEFELRDILFARGVRDQFQHLRAPKRDT